MIALGVASAASSWGPTVADTAAEKYDDAVQDGRGETEAALQAAEARLGTVVAEVTQSLKDGYKEGWDKAEAKAVDTLNAELIKLRDEFDRAKDHAKAEWERDAARQHPATAAIRLDHFQFDLVWITCLHCVGHDRT